ncbi:TfoX/Sxy family protein [Tropicimonas isoalkanivorans]|nr:TfoX/Sxy family protein [Tropicimonas isoalkanivorans]
MNRRLREAIGDRPGIAEKKMFGGVCVVLNGHMVGGASRDRTTGHGHYIFRVGKDNTETAEALPGGEPLVLGGKRLGGIFRVTEEEATDDVLSAWAALAVSHVSALPPKPTD